MQLSEYSEYWLKDLLVTKSEENTRSHPEHGRKDSPRWQYSAGHRPGR